MTNLTEKGRGIRDMFDRIAPRYDLLNRVLSLGIDRRWRRFAVRQLVVPKDGMVLDIATGTGDVALEIGSQTDPSVNIVGSDFTQGMLVLGRDKISDSPYRDRIMLVNAPCESMPHPDGIFDGITIAFGIRNVVDRVDALQEFNRALKPNGIVMILEFTKQDRSGVVDKVVDFGMKKVLPRVGGLISKNYEAYKYLPESIEEFLTTDMLAKELEEAGFEMKYVKSFSMGISTLLVAQKI